MSGASDRGSPTSRGFALLANTALPAITAWQYARYALAPHDFGDAWGESLALLFLAQLPLGILGAVYAGVSALEGPAWRRVAVYLGMVLGLGLLGGLVGRVWDREFGTIIGWAIAMQVTILVFTGPQPELARKRIDAVTTDAVHLWVLSVIGGLLATIAVLAVRPYAGTLAGDWRAFEPEASDLAWVGAALFAARTWSGAYVFTDAFDARLMGYFDRPWIDRVVRFGRAPPSTDG